MIPSKDHTGIVIGSKCKNISILRRSGRPKLIAYISFLGKSNLGYIILFLQGINIEK